MRGEEERDERIRLVKGDERVRGERGGMCEEGGGRGERK